MKDETKTNKQQQQRKNILHTKQKLNCANSIEILCCEAQIIAFQIVCPYSNGTVDNVGHTITLIDVVQEHLCHKNIKTVYDNNNDRLDGDNAWLPFF